tara:strand:- start:615 stop:1019 length:405 start_codon:yes stop_codon:yes gene_type:complete
MQYSGRPYQVTNGFCAGIPGSEIFPGGAANGDSRKPRIEIPVLVDLFGRNPGDRRNNPDAHVLPVREYSQGPVQLPAVDDGRGVRVHGKIRGNHEIKVQDTFQRQFWLSPNRFEPVIIGVTVYIPRYKHAPGRP